jgi:hypothetical protein
LIFKKEELIIKRKIFYFYFRCFGAVVFAVERFLELFVVPLDTVVGLAAVLRSGTS